MSDAEPAGAAATPEPLFTPPPPAHTESDGILDFSEYREPVRFRIGPEPDDVFQAASALPAGLAFEFIAAAREIANAGAGEDPTPMLAIFRRILLPADAERFEQRMSDLERPVSLQQFVRIIQGLFERYGLRPTAPPSASSDGSPSPDGGMPSTAALQWQAPPIP